MLAGWGQAATTLSCADKSGRRRKNALLLVFLMVRFSGKVSRKKLLGCGLEKDARAISLVQQKKTKKFEKKKKRKEEKQQPQNDGLFCF